VQSSLTGHMVFSTLHTNNAAGVIPRLIDLKVNPKTLVSALSLSMAQRLVRKLCKDCKKEKSLTSEENKIVKSVLESMQNEGKDLSKYDLSANSFSVFEHTGCEKCNMTGYSGRIGIFEAIKTDEGILSMRQDGMVKVLKGITSLEELSSVVDLLEE